MQFLCLTGDVTGYARPLDAARRRNIGTGTFALTEIAELACSSVEKPSGSYVWRDRMPLHRPIRTRYLLVWTLCYGSILASASFAADQPQWGQRYTRNMVSARRGLWRHSIRPPAAVPG